MKKRLLPQLLLSLGFFILLTPFGVLAQATPEPVELKLELTEEITENQVQELLSDKDYLITNLKGEVKVGDETITDFISKGKGETLEDVDELFQEQRQTLLVNMLQTQELSEENSEEMKQQFSRDELLTTIRETKNTPVKVKEISVITENQEKAQVIKDSLKDRSEIKDIRESIKEIQAERNEVREENQALKWLRNTLNFLFAPLRAVANSTPAWVPDFTSIAFFDTDEVGLNPYEDWVSFENSGNEITDIESHWWDTYVVADTGHSGGNDVIGNFTNDDGTGWTGWRNLPQHQGTPNDTQDHELVSVGNTLYNFYRTKSTFDVAPYDLFVRASYDGGYTWTAETAITDDMIAYSATKHYNDVCLSFYNYVDSKLQTKCVSDPLTTNWSTVSWNDLTIPVIDGGNRNIDLESQFGSLWLVYTDDILETKVRSSYDSGTTWNVISSESIDDGVITGEVELTAVGKPEWNNERLCLTTARYDGFMNGFLVSQSCLFKYFDQNGQYNAWNWTPWQIQEQVVDGSGSNIETTSDSSRLTQVTSVYNDKLIRTLEYESNPGRGYISYMRWNEDPSFEEGVQNTDGSWFIYPEGYEHEVYLNNYDYSTASIDYNQGKIYLENLDTGVQNGSPPNSCMPICRYSASNLPNAYIDTRLDEDDSLPNPRLYCDSEANGEISFTIGTPNGSEIVENAYYFTYIYTGKGELYKPIYKVQGTLTEMKYDFTIATGGYGGAWAAFGVPGATEKLIFDATGLAGTWVHSFDDERLNSYPYWYKESN